MLSYSLLILNFKAEQILKPKYQHSKFPCVLDDALLLILKSLF